MKQFHHSGKLNEWACFPCQIRKGKTCMENMCVFFAGLMTVCIFTGHDYLCIQQKYLSSIKIPSLTSP